MALHKRGGHTGRRFGRGACGALCVTPLAVGGARASGDAGQLDRAKAQEAFPAKPVYSPYVDRNYPTRPLFGDTHLHTGASFDAGAFGAAPAL